MSNVILYTVFTCSGYFSPFFSLYLYLPFILLWNVLFSFIPCSSLSSRYNSYVFFCMYKHSTGNIVTKFFNIQLESVASKNLTDSYSKGNSSIWKNYKYIMIATQNKRKKNNSHLNNHKIIFELIEILEGNRFTILYRLSWTPKNSGELRFRLDLH